MTRVDIVATTIPYQVAGAHNGSPVGTSGKGEEKSDSRILGYGEWVLLGTPTLAQKTRSKKLKTQVSVVCIENSEKGTR